MKLGYNSLSVLRSCTTVYSAGKRLGKDTEGRDGGPFYGTLKYFKGKDRDSHTNLIQVGHNTENKLKNDILSTQKKFKSHG
jgi:hypothetical protein